MMSVCFFSTVCIFFCTFNAFAQKPVGRNMTYTLDSTALDLYYDLEDISQLDFLIVGTTQNNSIDMFLAGQFTTDLDIYQFYEGSELIGSIGNFSIWMGEKDSVYPLQYRTKASVIVIKNQKRNTKIPNVSMYFKIHTYSNFIIQTLRATEMVLTIPNLEGNLKILNWGPRPRRLQIGSLETNSTEGIVVTGGIYNNSVPYFSFNDTTASNYVYSTIDFFGSVFNFHVQDNRAVRIKIAYSPRSENIYENGGTESSYNLICIITSPDYGETNRYQPANAVFHFFISGYSSTDCLLLELMIRNNLSPNASFYIKDAGDNIYSLKTQELTMPIWIESFTFDLYYEDNVFSIFSAKAQLFRCVDKPPMPTVVISTTLTTTLQSASITTESSTTSATSFEASTIFFTQPTVLTTSTQKPFTTNETLKPSHYHWFIICGAAIAVYIVFIL